MRDAMSMVSDGFVKQAAAPAGKAGIVKRIADWARAHPKTSVGLAAGSVGAVGGGLLGYQAHKEIGRAGSLDPNAMQEQLRDYKADRFGRY